MRKEEIDLFKAICSFKAKVFDETLLAAATPSVLGYLFFNRMQAIAYGTLKKHELLGKVNREFRDSIKESYELNAEKNKSYFWCVQHLEKLRQAAKSNAAMKKAGVNDKAIMESKTDSDAQNADIDYGFTNNGIEDYTERQYNRYGWAIVNNLLSKQEIGAFMSAIGNQSSEPLDKYSHYQYVVAVGNYNKARNTLIITDGYFDSPSIDTIIRINLDNETDIDELRRLMTDGYGWSSTFESDFDKNVYGEALIKRYNITDFPSYQELRGRGKSQSKRNDGRKDNQHYQGEQNRNGDSGETGSDEVKYSDIDDDIQTTINQTMTMQQAKDMIQRAFVTGMIEDFYDGQYKNGDEWLAGEGADEVAFYIENEYSIVTKYLNPIQGYIDDEIQLQDILNAYTNKTLTEKVKQATQWMDLNKNIAVADKRFYAPKEIKNAKKKLEIAKQKIDKSKKRGHKSKSGDFALTMCYHHAKRVSHQPQAVLSFAMMIYNSYGIGDMQDFVLMICTASP